MPVWFMWALMMGQDAGVTARPAPPSYAEDCRNGITRAGVGAAQTRALLAISVDVDAELPSPVEFIRSRVGVLARPGRWVPALQLRGAVPVPTPAAVSRALPNVGLDLSRGGMTVRVGALTVGIRLRLGVDLLLGLLEGAVSSVSLRCVERPTVARLPWQGAMTVAMANPLMPDLRVDLSGALSLLARIRTSGGASADPGSMVVSRLPWVMGDGWRAGPGQPAGSQSQNVFTPFLGSRSTPGFVGTQYAPPQFSTPPVVVPRQSGAPTAFQPSFTGGL